MPTLALPLCLCHATQPALRLDKAIKYLADKALPIDQVLLPHALATEIETSYRLTSEAARNGLCATFGEVPEANDPLTFFYDGEACDLRIPNDLCDWHAHTQFAYCGRGIDIKDAADFALELGIKTQGFAEHAFALYFASNALKFYWQSDRAYVESIWATEQRARMKSYKMLVQQLRTHYQGKVKFGLEVDKYFFKLSQRIAVVVRTYCLTGPNRPSRYAPMYSMQ